MKGSGVVVKHHVEAIVPPGTRSPLRAETGFPGQVLEVHLHESPQNLVGSTAALVTVRRGPLFTGLRPRTVGHLFGKIASGYDRDADDPSDCVLFQVHCRQREASSAGLHHCSDESVLKELLL